MKSDLDSGPRGPEPVVATLVGPRLRSLEGFTVNRVWPTARRRLIGPFIFLDHLQPVDLPAGAGLDVPPHPHIGLATVTWLFEGELMHRDSTGISQLIRPGDLNWMTAGRGITHSERTPAAERARPSRLHAVQAWVALPRASERQAPRFEHVPAAALTEFRVDAAELRLIAGEAYGHRAAVATDSPLHYLEAALPAGGAFELPAELGERGIYIVDGAIALGGRIFEAGRLIVLETGRPCRIEGHVAARLMLLGGAPLEADRAIWWNFVASDRALIETAKADWAAGRFPSVPGDAGYMPLPAA